jgi:NAD(P)H-nitrite reductase large subunit
MGNSKHAVIIGNGIAGVTAARHIRKNSDMQITIVSSETEYFFSRTALMYIYMGHMKYEHTKPYEDSFWKKNRINLVQDLVIGIDAEKKNLALKVGGTMSYDSLILATGSKPNKFGWPGQDLPQVQGLYSKQDLDKLEANAPNNAVCRRAVIVGGGLIGIEMAEMLISRNIPVTFLIREHSFWNGVLPNGDSELITQHILKHHVDLKVGVNLKEINADASGNVKSITIAETGEEIACNLVGLTAGVSPNIDFLKDTRIETKRGVLVNRNLETNIPSVYAIGDCAEQHEGIGNRRPIEAVWYTGRMMGEAVAQTICGNRKEYNPGHWFNSAKFFDIEYQTYGWVFAAPRDGETHFHWKHANGDKCMTVCYNTASRLFIGINTFGIRLRHETMDKWLTEQRSVDYVLQHLKEANFDPEFFTHYETEILDSFTSQTNQTVNA